MTGILREVKTKNVGVARNVTCYLRLIAKDSCQSKSKAGQLKRNLSPDNHLITENYQQQIFQYIIAERIRRWIINLWLNVLTFVALSFLCNHAPFGKSQDTTTKGYCLCSSWLLEWAIRNCLCKQSMQRFKSSILTLEGQKWLSHSSTLNSFPESLFWQRFQKLCWIRKTKKSEENYCKQCANFQVLFM